jgi:hypothetical protein
MIENQDMLHQKKIRVLTLRNASLLFICIILLVAIIITSFNLRDSFLWFDEAGQFWISKGLNHYSEPLQPARGLKDVIDNNARYNLDPGGFSLLLHYWSLISNTPAWLRMLPFMFYLGTIIAFIYLSYRWTQNLFVAISIGMLPILLGNIINMGFEIRAYSMEYFGVLLGVIALESLRTKITKSRLFLWSLILSLFMTSRYAIIVIYFVISLFVVVIIFRSNGSKKEKILNIAVYALPLLITLFLIYLLALRFQNPQLEGLPYLPYLADDWKNILLPITNLGYLVVLSGLAVLLYYSLTKSHKILRKYQYLLSITITCNFLFILFSWWGIYPWAPLSRSGLPFFILSLLCVSAILGEALMQILRRFPRVGHIAVVILIITALLIQINHITIRYEKDPLLSCLEGLNFSEYQNIYVDRWASPTIRYLFEFSALGHSLEDVYPERFNIVKFQSHVFHENKISRQAWYQAQPKMSDLTNYDLLIVPELSMFSASQMWMLAPGCISSVFIHGDT